MKDKQPGPDNASGASGAQDASMRGAVWRRLRDWLIALVVLPLAAMLMLEGTLRLIGYGVPPEFFEEVTLRGEPFVHPRYQYFDRFLPPGLSRASYTHGFPVKKAPATCRIFILGESAAIGEPETHSGFGHQLETLLCNAYPNAHFEVRNLAVASIDSHVIRCIAEELPRYQPDFVLVYMGNNEVVGPFGAGTPFQSSRMARYLVRPAIFLRSLRSYQGAERLVLRMFPGIRHSHHDSDMAIFARGQVAEDDPRLDQICGAFEDNLKSIIQSGIAGGAPVLVSTVGSNLSDFAPFDSLHREGLSPGDQSIWEAAVLQGDELAAQGTYEGALDAYGRAAAVDDFHAELHFKIGRSQWALERFREAGASFVRARDLDTLRFRADSKINEAIRGVVSTFPLDRALLVDAIPALESAAAGNIPGDDLFYDHVHFTPEGNYHLARAFFQAIQPRLPAWVSQGNANLPAAATMEEVFDLVPVTAWNRFRQYDTLLRLVRLPPFTNQWNWRERVHGAQEAFNVYASVPLTPHLRTEIRTRFENALTRRPNDLLLRETLAEYLFQAGDYAAAIAASGALIEREPYYAHGAAQFILADSLCALGRCEEAQGPYEQLVAWRPGAIEPRLTWARCLRGLGRDGEARREFDRCLGLAQEARDPLQTGRILEYMGRRDEAMEAYRAAILNNPPKAFPCEAFYRLLVEQGDAENQLDACRALARMKPEDAHVQHMLALALVKAERIDEAQAALAEAARLDPISVRSLLLSGELRAGAGDTPGAIEFQKRAIAREPRNYILHQQLANYLREAGELPGAAHALAAAYALNPYDRTLLDRLDETLRATGDLAFALEVWRGLVRQQPDAAPAHYGLGLALRAVDPPDDAAAETAFRQAIELEPGYRPAYDALIALLGERLVPEDLGPAVQELWDRYQLHAPPPSVPANPEAALTPAP